ncbi:MAG: YbgC/FadM family acyl-CoA thioesterase [Burkholderiaceae bacterium]
MNQKPTRQDFRFSTRLRVRWAEVDLQKIVFNAHYLMYFDTAISDYWRAMAIPYEETMHQWGGDLYVKKASVEYFASARYEDQLDVMLKCVKVGNSSVVFHGAIFRSDQLLVTCELIYVYANPATQTSQPVPATFRELLTSFEAGVAMTSVKTGDVKDLGADAFAIREEVFVNEQGFALEIEKDAYDVTSVHAVAYNRLGKPLATGRLLPTSVVDGVKTSKIGRMAVHRVMRGSKLGSDILSALVAAAKARGDEQVKLGSQWNAQNFYAKQGFTAQGEPFDDEGMPHIEMFMQL